jgi:hypothetical protein
MPPRSALNLEVFSRCFAPVWDFLVFDDLTFIQTAEASFLDRRNVDEDVFSAATLWLNKSISFLRVKPLHGAACHYRSSKGAVQDTAMKAKCQSHIRSIGNSSEHGEPLPVQ